MVNPTVCLVNTDQQHATPNVELADVVRRFGAEYRSQCTMLPSHNRALADIEACCTKQLGGRLYQCDDCSESFWMYHCCRNRACPKCHARQTEQWLAKRQAELLPCDYFHAVATVPSELRGVFQRHQKLMYGLLMRVAAEAVQELCAVRRHLGALPGILSIFHSWNGQLQYHPHVHMLITGGGISSDGQHWEPARGKFLVPVQVLSRKIAAKFRDALRKENPELWATIPANAWRREWVSFCKYYGRGNDAVLNYLSRYVFRTAISNARILGMDQTHVTFRWKDRNSDTWQTERLPGVEFLRRFLQHVLPRGFHRCRYYGLWHSSKRDLSSRAWLLLILQNPLNEIVPLTIADLLNVLSQPGEDEDRKDPQDDDRTPCCPHCNSSRITLLNELPRFGIP
ncbi:MAG: transposase [Pseudomonas sp.]|uniref:IS91 family transposase n=1 Tax=Pseudomonas sp. TaxID=306 RepID=UPI003C72488F